MLSLDNPDYVFINHASNAIGNVINVKAIFELTKKWKPIITLDAAQTIGLLDLRKVKTCVDFIVFAGHKNLQGPLGIGGFVTTKDMKLNVAFAGGTGADSLNLDMPESGSARYEIGSPNISAIAGLNAGIKWVEEIGLANLATHKKILISKLVKGLETIEKVILFKPKEEDFIDNMFIASTHDDILFFTDKGKVYSVKGYNIPVGTRTARGRAIVNVIQLGENEKVRAMIQVKSDAEGYIVLASGTLAKGTVVNTPFGKAGKVYDSGCAADTLDVYTNF
jgi:selenocysteine lyase/cysteine desulfurase